MTPDEQRAVDDAARAMYELDTDASWESADTDTRATYHDLAEVGLVASGRIELGERKPA